MKAYRIVSRDDSQSLAEYVTENGQILLPMVELIEGSRMAIDELIDVPCQYRSCAGVVGARSRREQAAGPAGRERTVVGPEAASARLAVGMGHIVLTGDYDWNSGAVVRTNARPLNLYPTRIHA